MRIRFQHHALLYFTLLLSFDVTISAYQLQSPLYGTEEINEPILVDILESPCMQRLKNIQQYGLAYYIDNKNKYSRYDHSVGVFMILRKFGASLKEQIAGLLHDASHTVFSHLADTLFKKNDIKESYQDSIHEWFLNQTEIPDILKKYSMTLKDILHKNKAFCMLEQDLPNLCADRIEYNIYGGFIANYLSKRDVQNILNSLGFENGTWFFKDIKNAEKLARTSLYLNEHYFASSENWFINTIGSHVLQRLLDLHVITTYDIHFSTDLTIWHLMQSSSDEIIQSLMQQLFDHKKQIITLNNYSLDADFIIFQKFRGIDPFVKINGSLARLTTLNHLYAHDFELLYKKLKKGISINVSNNSLKQLLHEDTRTAAH